MKLDASKIVRFLLWCLCCLCVTGIAQDSAEPPDHGCYYRAKDGWKKLEPVTSAGVKAGAFSGITVSYRDAGAPVQLLDHRPVFYIKTTPDKQTLLESAMRSMVIVRLEQKKDHREVQVGKSGLFGANVQIDKKRVIELTVHSVNDLLLTAAPNEDLTDGEYLLTYDKLARGGYDFGITTAK